MNTYKITAMAAAGTVSAIAWIVLFLRNCGKYDRITNTAAAVKIKFHELFFIGFALMKIFNVDIKSRRFSVMRGEISSVFGSEYTEYYTYLFEGAQITYAATLFPVTMLAGAASGSTAPGLLGAAASVLMLFWFRAEVRKKAAEKKDALLCDLPDAVMRLALLLNAGMVLRDAWKMISESSDSELCLEMRKTSDDIRNGIPEQDAYSAFADRCRCSEARKFISSLTQNLKKGNAGLSESLQQLASEQWEEKKNYIRKKAGAAEQKLLLPMIMMFAAIIMMIIVPVFTNML